MYRFLLIMVLFVGFLNITFCNENEKNLKPYSGVNFIDEENEEDAKPPEEDRIKIGIVLPLSGELKNYGVAILNGFILALDEVNQELEEVTSNNVKPMILDKEIKLVVEDTLLSNKHALTIIEKLAYIDRVDAIVGGYSSDITIQMSGVIKRANLTFISPASISDEITFLNDNNTIFRTVPSADYQGEFLGKIASKNMDYQYVGILHQDNSYGKSFADAFKSEFTRDRGICDLFPYNYNDIPYNLSELIANLTSNMERYGGEKAVFIVGYPEDTSSIINYIQDYKMDVDVLFGDGIQNPSVIKSFTGNYFDRLWGIGKSSFESSYNEEFINKYQSKFETPIINYTYNAYDAMAILLLAMAKTGDIEDKEGLKQAVIYVTNSPGEVIQAGEISKGIEALKNGDDIDYQGLVGDLEFDENGDVFYDMNYWIIADSEIIYMELIEEE